jgi:hypothetical protein
MAQYGMGVLYEKTDAGEPLRKPNPELKTHSGQLLLETP